MGYRIGIDVGGTFTDFLVVDEATGVIRIHKTPSTPDDPSLAIIDGLKRFLSDATFDVGSIDAIVHGTTIATNAVLEGKGALVGLLTTAGFEQVLHLARGETPGPLAGWVTMLKPDPLAPLELTRGVRERTLADGTVATPLDEVQATAAIAELLDNGVDALAVSLLNSYANSQHEEQLLSLIERVDGEIPVSLSSRVLPEFREYERTNLVVMNAYVRPIVDAYLRKVKSELRGLGIQAPFFVLRSDGGVMSVEAAIDHAVHTLFSGPAGGVAGAVRIAVAAGYNDFLSLDIGGTSTDVALCLGGEPTITRDTKLGFFPVKAPSIDVRSVGAGGGSIAHVPEITRALRVGPDSAGAAPGPACYGLGGTEATVTDANLVLGYLPESLLGGEMRLDRALAVDAVQTVAEKLGLTVEQAAQGILDIANEAIVGALRLVSIEKGHDPREFALVAFGGAGPLHADAVARLIGTTPVVVPPTPGVLAAYGDAFSPLRRELTRTFIRRFDTVSPAEVVRHLDELIARGEVWLTSEGASTEQQTVITMADVRYHQQALEMPLVVQREEILEYGFTQLAEAFAQAHEREYGFTLSTVCEFVNLRAVALAPLSVPVNPDQPAGDERDAVPAGSQQIYYHGDWLGATVYERDQLHPGATISGPALVIQRDTTTVILPQSKATVDLHLNLVIVPPMKTEPDTGADSPIVIDIIENALKNIRREMDAVVFRAAMSTVIREEHDSFPLLSDSEGRMLAGQFGWPIGDFLSESYSRAELNPGDVLMLNDPYLCGGAVQHTPDLLVMRPIFYANEIVGFASQIGNLMDIGGPVPGSMPARARSIFDEGIRFPPVKLYDRGELVESITAILGRNSRTPEATIADALALAAATRVAEQRVIELCGRFGVNTYRDACNRLLARTRHAAADMIRASIPEEPLRFADFVDDDGAGNGPFKIQIAVWREEERAIIDFAGSDRQAEGPINLFMSEAMFKMVMGIILIMALDPQIVFNHGYNELFEVRFPDASIVQPRFPAPLGNRSHTLARIFDVLQGALAQQNPSLATGAGCGSSPHFLYSGFDKDGAFFFYYEINYGGIPGRPIGDGLDVHAWWPHVTSIPIEYAESYFPLVIEGVRARPDSGGSGKHRGGNGVEKIYRFTERGELSIHDDRHVSRPWGIGGGHAAIGSEKVLRRANGEEIRLPSKVDFVQVEPGDRLLYRTAGGGGWGDPLDRDVSAVRLDVIRRLVTEEAALAAYGVVLGGTKLLVDPEATVLARAEIRKARPAPELFDRGDLTDAVAPPVPA